MTNQIAIEALVQRETEKALLIEVVTGRGDHRQVWFPKSQIRQEGKVVWMPGWLRDAKAREIGGMITLDPAVAARLAN